MSGARSLSGGQESTTLPDRPTGEQLYQELFAEARRQQRPVASLARKIWNVDPRRRLEQLRCSAAPLPVTVDRIRAVIAGKPVEPATARDPTRRYVRRRSGNEAAERLANLLAAKAEIERRRMLSLIAQDRRLPGETLEAATARIALTVTPTEGTQP